MNERIQELAEQCWNLPIHSEYMNYRKFDQEKFAMLIIKECTDLFPGLFTDEQYPVRIEKAIKKHFGVE